MKTVNGLVIACLLSSCSGPWFIGDGPYEDECVLMVRSPALAYAATSLDPDDVRRTMDAARASRWGDTVLRVRVADHLGRSFGTTVTATPDRYGNAWCRLPKPVWYALAAAGTVIEGEMQAEGSTWRFELAYDGQAAKQILAGRKWGRTIGIVVDPESKAVENDQLGTQRVPPTVIKSRIPDHVVRL